MQRTFGFFVLGGLALMIVATGAARASSIQRRTATMTRSTLKVSETGDACTDPAGNESQDSMAYTDQWPAPQGQLRTAYTSGCLLQTDSTADMAVMVHGCADGQAPGRTKGEIASFSDGLEVIVCTVPDVTLNHRTKATKGSPLNVVRQGFNCDAEVWTGSSDSAPKNIRGTDSIQFDQFYVEYDGTATWSVTTVCVGTVPAGTTVASTIVTHELECSQRSPFGGADIGRASETVTFPSGRYEELCQAPNVSHQGP